MENVLFVCIENSCRSQMAEGFAAQFGKNVLKAYSSGSKPSGLINPIAVKVMKEAGIDISSQKSKGFNDLAVKEFDRVITMGCGDACPIVPSRQHIDWNIENPKGKDVQFFRKTRDDIKYNVINLIKEISLKTEDCGGR